MKFLKQIPNAVTLSNLLLGCASIVFAFQGSLIKSAVCILLAGVADFLDGMLARLFKSDGELGKQLDSLSDVVSFGVAPGMILYNMSQMFQAGIWANFVFMIPLFSALRLAKFNIDTRQVTGFIGLPTPAMAYFVASIPLAHEAGNVPWIEPWLHTNAFYMIVSVLLSWLMISPIPMFSLKFSSKHRSNFRFQILLLTLGVGFIALFQFFGIAMIIFSYIILSIVYTFAQSKEKE